jgi:hypothetical protein
VLLAGCLERDRQLQITGCDPGFGLFPDCRFRSPQDMAIVPGAEMLVVSQPAHAGGTGELLLYEPLRAFAGPVATAGSLKRLYPGAAIAPEVGWGDDDCEAPDADEFSPRGIDSVRRSDGRIEVAAVNQGRRRAVELFELVAALEPPADRPPTYVPAVDDDQPQRMPAPIELALLWRGCVRSPTAASFGDIAADPRGGFWVTQAFPRQHPFWSYLKARLGFSTGYLYRWHPKSGFERVAGTEARLPSGIALAHDGSHVFYGTYLGDEVLKFDLASGEVVGRTVVMQPNKMSWGRDGRLLVASHTAGFLERGQCDDEPVGACGFSFEVVSIEPDSMDASVLLAHRGMPIGGVDAAVNLGDSLYLASHLGDRIVRFPLSPRARR